jgi:hypothetical protein
MTNFGIQHHAVSLKKTNIYHSLHDSKLVRSAHSFSEVRLPYFLHVATTSAGHHGPFYYINGNAEEHLAL